VWHDAHNLAGYGPSHAFVRSSDVSVLGLSVSVRADDERLEGWSFSDETWSCGTKLLMVIEKLWSASKPGLAEADPAESDQDTRSTSRNVRRFQRQ